VPCSNDVDHWHTGAVPAPTSPPDVETPTPLGASKLSNIEKHELIRAALLDLIQAADDGDPLPSERFLAESLDVARMTVRKVIDVLVRQGKLRRMPGKGTFVSRSRLINSVARDPFSQLGPGNGSSVTARTLELFEDAAGSRLGQRLQLAPSARVFKATRVCAVDQESLALERIFLPAHLVSGLRASDLEALVLDDMLKTSFSISVARTSQVLRVTSVDDFEAQTLGVPVYSAAFFVTTTKVDTEDRVVQFVEGVYRGDRYRFLDETLAEDGTGLPAGAALNPRFIIN
jgi:GntR family transcriptional regulator